MTNFSAAFQGSPGIFGFSHASNTSSGGAGIATWWRRVLQNRSYSGTHPATSRSGSPRIEMRTSRPFLLRSMRLALSSSLRCFVTAFKAVSNGFAISRNLAGPFANCLTIARRVGCEMASRTSVRWNVLPNRGKCHSALDRSGGRKPRQPLDNCRISISLFFFFSRQKRVEWR